MLILYLIFFYHALTTDVIVRQRKQRTKTNQDKYTNQPRSVYEYSVNIHSLVIYYIHHLWAGFFQEYVAHKLE